MWKYSEETLRQFKEQKNAGEIENPDGRAEIGNASCGDALTLTFKLDDEGRIADAKFLTYGCVSAIAASSMLTQMIIGLTLDEALKITNKDIADKLGGLPEAKMHCSVMGMEALHAAIANYRGEPNPFESNEDHEGRLICRCFGVTDVKVLKVARENQLRNADEVTQYCKAGGACGSCLDDIQRILDDMWKFDQALKK